MAELLSLPQYLLEKEIFPNLSWKDTLSLELTCKLFREILLRNKERRKNEYLLRAAFGIEKTRREDLDELLYALDNKAYSLYRMFLFHTRYEISKMADLLEGIHKFSEEEIWNYLKGFWKLEGGYDGIKLIEELDEQEKQKLTTTTCSFPLCSQLCLERIYSQLCAKHLHERYERDRILQVRMLVEYGKDISSSQTQMNKNDLDIFLQELKKSNIYFTLPFQLKHVVYAFSIYHDAVTALCLGEPLIHLQNKSCKVHSIYSVFEIT
jgi:hypothetical protein